MRRAGMSDSVSASDDQPARHREVPGYSWISLTTIASNVSALLTAGIAFLALSTEYGARQEEREERAVIREYEAKVREIEIQAQLRERWMDWHQATAHLELDRYPENGALYSLSDRQLIRQYWTAIVNYEWATCLMFGDGVYAHLWESTYSVYPTSSLTTVKVLREEWCEYARPSPGGNTFAKDRFVVAIHEIARSLDPPVDCEVELADRTANIEAYYEVMHSRDERPDEPFVTQASAKPL